MLYLKVKRQREYIYIFSLMLCIRKTQFSTCCRGKPSSFLLCFSCTGIFLTPHTKHFHSDISGHQMCGGFFPLTTQFSATPARCPTIQLGSDIAYLEREHQISQAQSHKTASLHPTPPPQQPKPAKSPDYLLGF